MYAHDPLENPLRIAVGFLVLLLIYFFTPRYRNFALPAVALAFGLTEWALRIRRRRASGYWAFSTGTVESVSIRSDSDSLLSGPWIVGFEEKRYYRESSANENAVLEGTQVTVRYNLESPDESLLDSLQLR